MVGKAVSKTLPIGTVAACGKRPGHFFDDLMMQAGHWRSPLGIPCVEKRVVSASYHPDTTFVTSIYREADRQLAPVKELFQPGSPHGGRLG
jgi:hypothetical protein